MSLLPLHGKDAARVGRALAIMMLAFLVGSCAESTAPTKMRAPGSAKKSLSITDWYSCWRHDSSVAWEGCDYIGSDTTYIASWADFDLHPDQPTSLAQVKVTNSECPQCDDPNQFDAPQAYFPYPDPNDNDQRAARPDCRYRQANSWDQAWCDAKAPQYIRKARLHDALMAMDSLPDQVCKDLAELGLQLWNLGVIRVYDPNPNGSGYQGGGYAPTTLGGNGWILLNSISTDVYWDKNHYSTESTTLPDGTVVNFHANLQFDLAHELDHLMSPDNHLDPKPSRGWLTAHAIQCSGLPRL